MTARKPRRNGKISEAGLSAEYSCISVPDAALWNLTALLPSFLPSYFFSRRVYVCVVCACVYALVYTLLCAVYVEARGQSQISFHPLYLFLSKVSHCPGTDQRREVGKTVGICLCLPSEC